MIPVFTGARANAILSKDTANVRSAYADAVVDAMSKATYGNSGKLEVEIDVTQLNIDKSTTVTSQSNNIRIYTTGATNGNWSGHPDSNLINVDVDIKLTVTTGKNESFVING